MATEDAADRVGAADQNPKSSSSNSASGDEAIGCSADTVSKKNGEEDWQFNELEFFDAPVMIKSIYELELSVRTVSCLRNGEIAYVGDLVQKTETELLHIQYVNGRVINEIKETLEEMGLQLGMGVPSWPPKHAEFFARKNELRYQKWEKLLASGRDYATKGQHDRAIAAYGEAIQLNPRARAFYDRGNAYESKEDYDLAIADYSEAIRLNPKEALAFGHR